MSNPLAGKRYFHAKGMQWKAMGQNLRTAHFGGMPLWARNAFTEGCMGVELIRRPAWTEKEKP